MNSKKVRYRLDIGLCARKYEYWPERKIRNLKEVINSCGFNTVSKLKISPGIPQYFYNKKYLQERYIKHDSRCHAVYSAYSDNKDELSQVEVMITMHFPGEILTLLSEQETVAHPTKHTVKISLSDNLLSKINTVEDATSAFRIFKLLGRNHVTMGTRKVQWPESKNQTELQYEAANNVPFIMLAEVDD